jgi:hypothetical protein
MTPVLDARTEPSALLHLCVSVCICGSILTLLANARKAVLSLKGKNWATDGHRYTQKILCATRYAERPAMTGRSTAPKSLKRLA